MSRTGNAQTGFALHERTVQEAIAQLAALQSRIPRREDLADALQVPHSEIARLFPDDLSIIRAAGEHALIHLIDDCTKAVVQVDPNDAVAQFWALGDAYLLWVDQYREQYRLLTNLRVIDSLNTPELRRYVDSIHNLMVRMLERARDAGQLHPKENIEILAITTRAFAYGLGQMIVDERMREWDEKVDPLAMARRILLDFITRICRRSSPRGS